MPQTFIKDPSAVLDYKFDWKPLTNGVSGAASDWLASGETISSFVITADTGITVGDGTNGAAAPSKTDANTSVTVWLLSGTAGVTYTVACKIVTSASRTDERSIHVLVGNL